MQEVEKIKKEQEKVRQEIKNQENEDEPTVEPRNPVDDEKKKDDNKEKPDGKETNGSEA